MLGILDNAMQLAWLEAELIQGIKVTESCKLFFSSLLSPSLSQGWPNAKGNVVGKGLFFCGS